MNIGKIFFLSVILNFFILSQQWNDIYLHNLLTAFLGYMDTREMIFFLSQHMTSEHTKRLDKFMQRLTGANEMTQYVWTNRSDVRMMRLPSKRYAMTIVFTTSARDPIMKIYSRITTGRHAVGTIIVYVDKVEEMAVINDICRFLYKGSFYLSFVHFETSNGLSQLYGYEQYPEYTLENRTDVQTFATKLFKRIRAAKQDVGGYKFFTPIKRDLPKVFKVHDKQGKSHLYGTAVDLLETFISSLNGSLEEYKPSLNESYEEGEYVNMKEVLELVRSRKIDMSVHAYALFQADDDLDKSYPIMVVKWCLMVPQRNSVSTYLYLLQPFEQRIWFLLIGVGLLLWLVDILGILCGTSKTVKSAKLFALLNNAWFQNFCLLLNLNTSRKISLNSCLHFPKYITIFFFGFFLIANYTSLLGSILTVTLFRDQINTMDDLVQAQLPVMVVDYELDFLLNEGYEMPLGFKQLLRAVDTKTFAQHQFGFNISFAYFVTEDTWHFLDEAQKHLRQRLFKFSDICFGSYHLAFPMQTDSAVWRDLEYYIYRTHSNGLVQMYEQTTFQLAVQAGYIQRLVESYEYSAAGWDHLVVIFMGLGAMYVAGGISLIVEIVIKQI